MTAQEIIASVPTSFDGVTLTKADFATIVGEIKRLGRELAAIKTAKPCVECSHWTFTHMGYLCAVAPVDVRNYSEPWLCGHFLQKKGTV